MSRKWTSEAERFAWNHWITGFNHQRKRSKRASPKVYGFFSTKREQERRVKQRARDEARREAKVVK